MVRMKDPYYMLKIYSPDLIFELIEERHPTKQGALDAIKAYRKQYHITHATIRHCTDVYHSKRVTRPKRGPRA